MKLELTPEQRKAAAEQLESFIGPSLAGYPNPSHVDFDGAIDLIIYAVNASTNWSAK